jgi:hypothetical protein
MSDRRLVGYRVRVNYGPYVFWLRAEKNFDLSLLKENAVLFDEKDEAKVALDQTKGCPWFISTFSKILRVYRKKKIRKIDAVETNASINVPTNGGVECDVIDGPCACGAWHQK